MGKPHRFELKILECVDSALGNFGESAKQSIYYHLKSDFMLEKSEILQKPEVFEKALTSIFGEEGYKVIEKMILTEIRKNFKLKRSLNFREVVKVLESHRTCTSKGV
jgi:N-dimethylarginine dimethylaminohydrolase